MNRKSKYRILVVDDEPDILEFLSYNMKQEGYEVATADNGKKAIEVAAEQRPHLIILDVMMPGMDGIETCEELRKNGLHNDTLIMFLTARSEDYSQVAGFNAGADDYTNKPVKPKVLLSRIKALLRRAVETGVQRNTGSNHKNDFESRVKLDRERFVLIYDDKDIVLPKKEFELMSLLMSKPDKVFTRSDIFNRIWDNNTIVGERTIDVHIRKLREKIGDGYIKTVKGVGYKYVPHD